ncbi:MAG: tetratricopeptide repeat protein, partial [Pyrinomonadaceae bacterium]
MSIDANLKLIGHLYSTRNLFSLLGLAGHNDKLKFFGHIGKALGVDAVLEGYIQRDGDRIRATARLVNVRDGSQLWAGRFDDSFTNVFSVQDSISAQVAHSLSPALVSDEKQALTKRHTANTEAYLEYLKGRHFWNKRTAESLGSSIENFQKAIELDPNYALAYAGLADAYALLVWNIGPVNPELINKARTAARKALELDFTLAEAHTSLAFTRCWYEWDWQGAESEFKKAIELNPNYATAHHWYGEFLVLMGRFEEGFRELRFAQEIDPLSLIINSDIGKMHFLARRPEQAIDQLLKTTEMDPNFPISHLFLAMAYRQKGMYE